MSSNSTDSIVIDDDADSVNSSLRLVARFMFSDDDSASTLTDSTTSTSAPKPIKITDRKLKAIQTWSFARNLLLTNLHTKEDTVFGTASISNA